MCWRPPPRTRRSSRRSWKPPSRPSEELVAPFLQWRYNGRPAGNGWNSPVNNAKWGTDYLNRTATAKSNIYENRPEETKYIYTDNDSQGKQLNGQNIYAITFAKGQTASGQRVLVADPV